MKLKTNKKKNEATITLDYNEINILMVALKKWNDVSLSYLPMMKINELLEKIGTAKQTIDKNIIPKH